jgi:DNA-directed RNA polymerase specialized sigma24 family protein
MLYYFYNFTYAEIGTSLRVCVETVKVRIHRAKKIIREKFTKFDSFGVNF